MKLFNFNITRNKPTEVVEDRSFSNLALPFGAPVIYDAAMSLSAVFNAVSLISNSIAQLPMEITTKTGEIEHFHSYLDAAFDNSFLGKFNLLKNMIQDMLLYGNGYCYIKRTENGTPYELVYLPYGDVVIHYNKAAQTLYYSCNFIKNKRIEPCDIIHIRKEADQDGIQGVGFITYAMNTILTAQYSERSATSFFESGCAINGILKYTGTLSDKQKQDIRDNWNQTHGNGNGGLAVFGGNVEYIPITLSAKESQLLESRLFSVQEVARFFSISPTLLGDLTKTSYASLEQSQLNFLLNCLSPIIMMMEEEFTRKLIMPSKKGFMYISIDENFLLKSDKQATANYLNTLVSGGILTINEARQILGFKEVDGGDKNTVAYTKIQDNIINE